MPSDTKRLICLAPFGEGSLLRRPVSHASPLRSDVSKAWPSAPGLIRARAAHGPLVARRVRARLIDHFQPVERGVIMLRLKGQHQLSLGIRSEMVEGPHHSVID